MKVIIPAFLGATTFIALTVSCGTILFGPPTKGEWDFLIGLYIFTLLLFLASGKK